MKKKTKISHPFTTLMVAKLYMHHVYRLRGRPQSIISDHDWVFTGHLWQELTERVNQFMETFIRCFVNACPSKWIEWIYLARLRYNTTWHSALGFSPFYVLYGHQTRHFGISDISACTLVFMISQRVSCFFISRLAPGEDYNYCSYSATHEGLGR
jgi:hypothetical protein